MKYIFCLLHVYVLHCDFVMVFFCFVFCFFVSFNQTEKPQTPLQEALSQLIRQLQRFVEEQGAEWHNFVSLTT